MHVPVNVTNFFVIGLTASLFIGGGMFILIWLGTINLPILSPVARVVIGAVHKL